MKQLLKAQTLTLITSCLLISTAESRIQVISTNSYGSGCSSDGSAIIQMSPDNSSVTILYNDLKVQSENRTGYVGLDCKSDIDLRIPSGMQLELRSVDYRGFVALSDENITGRIASAVCFRGGSIEYPNQRTRQSGCTNVGGFGRALMGPMTEDFFFQSGVMGKDNFGRDVSVRNLSRCNGVAKLRIKTTASMTSNSAQSFGELSLDSADFQFSQKYNLVLAPCDKQNTQLERVCRQGTCHEYDLP